MAEENPTFFTIRVPNSLVDANGQRVECYQEIRYRSDRGNDAQMHPAEYAAFCDLMLDKVIRWTSENADGAKRIDRHAVLYLWWNAFIEFALGQVPIGSDEFRQSRAGLIHPTHLNSIRRDAKLSPADFKSLSLAEVFAVISDIHCREHNEENRRRQQADGTPQKPTAEKRYSLFREPQEWLRLRKLKGLSNSRNTWQALLKKHGSDIDCESTKSARISFELAVEWGLKLPEFEAITIERTS